MRFSAVAALCAAPLALAGTLQAELVARGAVGVEVSESSGSSGSSGSSKSSDSQKSSSSDNSKDNSSNNNNKGNGNTVLIEQNTINEVVVIWVNNGGGAATSTVTDTVTVTQNGAASVAAATHQVRRLSIAKWAITNSISGYRWWICWACLYSRYHRSCSWGHGGIYLRVTEPHRHAVRFHDSLRQACDWHGFRVHAQP